MNTLSLNFSRTEQWIITTIAHNPISSTDLVLLYQGPKQSIYKALRSLVMKNVIISDPVIQLSKVWIHDISNLISYSQYSTEPMWDLQDGERLVYYFNDFTSCDNYLCQLYLTLPENINSKDIFVFHNPHQWFFVNRRKTEELFWNRQYEMKRTCFVSVLGNTPIDKHIGRDLLPREPFIKFSRSTNRLPAHTYYSITGDWILLVIAPEGFNNSVEKWFKTHKIITKENIQELTNLTSKKTRIKMTIEKNKKKANQLRKKILKDFI